MAAWGQSRGKRQAARRRNFVRKGVVCVGGWFVKPHADWGEGGGHARKRRADTHEPPHGSRWECRHVGRHAGRICVRGVGCAWAARVSGRKWPSMWLLRASNGRSRRIAMGPRNGHQPSPPFVPDQRQRPPSTGTTYLFSPAGLGQEGQRELEPTCMPAKRNAATRGPRGGPRLRVSRRLSGARAGSSSDLPGGQPALQRHRHRHGHGHCLRLPGSADVDDDDARWFVGWCDVCDQKAALQPDHDGVSLLVAPSGVHSRTSRGDETRRGDSRRATGAMDDEAQNQQPVKPKYYESTLPSSRGAGHTRRRGGKRVEQGHVHARRNRTS